MIACRPEMVASPSHGHAPMAFVASFFKPCRNLSMSTASPAELELAQLLVESLNLEDIQASDIEPEAALFNDGLGLDSIDALELSLAISKRYGFQLRSDSDENRRIFSSLRALSAHVDQNRAA